MSDAEGPPAAVAEVERVLDTSGPAAPPRGNGVLIFQAPWESRVFGLTLALHGQGGFAWDEFRDRLIAAIARAEAQLGPDETFHYYACWMEALQALLADKKLCEPGALETREEALAARPVGHDH
jgi:nitrile hydratase accessory protein